MASTINLKVTSDFDQASADLKKFNNNLSETERKKVQKYFDTYKDTSINKFLDRQKKATIAIKATRGPVEAAASEFRALQREMERLIKKGIDPQDDALKPLIARYNKLEKEMKDVGKAQLKNQKTMKLAQGAMLGLGAAAVLMAKRAGDAFIDFAKESEAAASDAIEVFSKFDTVFESIQASASVTADKVADSFGIAESTSRELLSATGDILVGFGFSEKAALSLAKQTTELSADLASFTNFEGGAARASAALTKALVGEAESVKALGIVIRQDTKEYKDLIKSLMETNNVSQIQAKALAALQIATEQSGKAIGDVARTWDSAANVSKRLAEQTKGLREAIGAGLLPTVTAIRSKFGEWAEAITEVIDRNNELRDAEKAAAEGNQTREQAIFLLQKEIDFTERRRDLVNESTAKSKEEIEITNRLASDRISATQEQIDLIQKLIDAENAKKQAIIDGDKELEFIEARKADISAAELDAITELARREFEALAPQEQRLELIQQEIDNLATLRNEADVLGTDRSNIQNLINDLYRERIDLQKDEIDINNALFATEESNILMLAERKKELSDLTKQQNEQERKDLKKIEDEYKKLGNTIAGFTSGTLEALGAALTQNKGTWKALQQAAVGAIADIIRALGKQAVVQAALSFAGGNIPAGTAYTAAAIGASIAAGAIDALAGSLPEGGSFTTNGPMPVMVGDNIGGREKVTVEPVSSTGLNVDDTGGRETSTPQTIIAQFGNRALVGVIQDIFDDHEVRVPREIIV